MKRSTLSFFGVTRIKDLVNLDIFKGKAHFKDIFPLAVEMFKLCQGVRPNKYLIFPEKMKSRMDKELTKYKKDGEIFSRQIRFKNGRIYAIGCSY